MNSMRKNGFFTLFLCFLLCAVVFAAGCGGTEERENTPYIVSFEKTAADGEKSVYTITYSDGTTSQFTVTNGADGNDGADLSVSDLWQAYMEETGKDLSLAEFIEQYLRLRRIIPPPLPKVFSPACRSMRNSWKRRRWAADSSPAAWAALQVRRSCRAAVRA